MLGHVPTMKLIRYNTVAEAEACILLLQSQGVHSAEIRSDDAGGMLPALGSVSGYVIEVSEQEWELATSVVVVPTEKDKVANDNAPPSSSRIFWGSLSVCIALIFFAIGYYFGHNATSSKTRISVDRNWDTITDEEFFMDGHGGVAEYRRDRNFDGKMDEIIKYSGGAVSDWKQDDDFDGNYEVLTMGAPLGLSYAHRQIAGSQLVTGETTYYKNDLPSYRIYWDHNGVEFGRTDFEAGEPKRVRKKDSSLMGYESFELDEIGLPAKN